MSSYEVLHHLEHSSGGRMRMCDLAEQAGASQRELAVLREVEREAVVDHGVAVARVRTKRVPREHPAAIASSATKETP